jgi:dTDP-4-amino-4,6-dideoxygalactose transaminase
VDEFTVAANGINAKMSELHAAVGLAQLPGMEQAIAQRRRVAEHYLRELAGVPGVILPNFSQALRPNYAFMPVHITPEAAVDREDLVEQLRSQGVVPRCYFHPLIPECQYYRSNASADPALYPVATRASVEVLCLPIYPDLSDAAVLDICRTIRTALTA